MKPKAAARTIKKTARMVRVKITLKGFKPPIWRRVDVPAWFHLDDLHRVIQNCFAWHDYHLHAFTIDGVSYEPPDPYNDNVEGIDERKVSIESIGLEPGRKFRYTYDFGDSWEHEITVEKVFEASSTFVVPVCCKGKGGNPREDSGGPYGCDQRKIKDDFSVDAVNRKFEREFGKGLISSIADAKEDLKAGRTYSHAEMLEELDKP